MTSMQKCPGCGAWCWYGIEHRCAPVVATTSTRVHPHLDPEVDPSTWTTDFDTDLMCDQCGMPAARCESLAERTDGRVSVCCAGCDHDPGRVDHSAVFENNRRALEDFAQPDVAPQQDLINAATVIKRIANRHNRHPATAAILLPIAEDLRRRAFGPTSTDAVTAYLDQLETTNPDQRTRDRIDAIRASLDEAPATGETETDEFLTGSLAAAVLRDKEMDA